MPASELRGRNEFAFRNDGVTGSSPVCGTMAGFVGDERPDVIAKLDTVGRRMFFNRK